MTLKCVKSLLVAGFSVFFLAFSISTFAQEEHSETGDNVKKEEKKGFDANEVIFGHILDAHEFHFFSYEGSDGKEHEASIPLPRYPLFKAKGPGYIYVFAVSSWRSRI